MKKMISTFKKGMVVVVTAAVAAPAFAEGETSAVDTIFAAVDLTKIGGFVATSGAVIIGLTLAFKGISLAKRLVSRA